MALLLPFGLTVCVQLKEMRTIQTRRINRERESLLASPNVMDVTICFLSEDTIDVEVQLWSTKRITLELSGYPFCMPRLHRSSMTDNYTRCLRNTRLRAVLENCNCESSLFCRSNWGISCTILDIINELKTIDNTKRCALRRLLATKLKALPLFAIRAVCSFLE